MQTALTDSEQQLRAKLEQVIFKGKQTFLDVGGALLNIRNLNLYRSTHDTFESYCKEVHGFTRSYAHRLIDAAEVAELLPIGNKPKNEGQARELAKVEPEKRAEVLEKAQEIADKEGRPMTARDIANVAAPKSNVITPEKAAALMANVEPVKTEPPVAKDSLATQSEPIKTSRAYSLGAFQEETEGLAEIALSEFDADELKKAAGQLEMLAAKLRSKARAKGMKGEA